ncbi:methionyl-tRNA formyltransferase [Aestuariibius insulae]|uniref:methionyl-tRNA formyltransferase n=1 Tax=Aestuariibius insulae TaxID=2058287 RepID=UPI00345E5236
MTASLAVFGNKTTTETLLRHLIEGDITPDLVITLGAAARGKVAIAGASDSLGDLCQTAGIEVYEAESYALSSTADRAFFAGRDFGLGLCTGWQRLIPQAVLDRFAAGVFGWHGSLMAFPHGRGRSPLNWSIRLGGDRVYHNCFRYRAGVDDGPVFEMQVLPITPETEIADLQGAALEHIKASAVEVIRACRSGSLEERLIEQPPGPSVMLPKITPDDGRLTFQRSDAAALSCLIRSCARPFPGAFATVNGTPVARIWRATVLEVDGPPGQVRQAEDSAILIPARNGSLRIDELDMLAGSSRALDGAVLD